MNNNLNSKKTVSNETQKTEDYFSTPNVTPQRVISGLKNISEYFGCHPQTVIRNYKKGLYGKSMRRFGKDYVFNPDILWS